MSVFGLNASLVMSNVQGKAAYANSALRGVIANLQSMLDEKYSVPATQIDANIPQVDMADLPDLIDEVKGYLNQIVIDSQNIEGAVTNNAGRAISRLEELFDSLKPAELDVDIPELSVSFAQELTDSARAVIETARKSAEVEVLAKYAARNFPSPPGSALDTIAKIRQKTAVEMGSRASEAISKQQEQNAKLFVSRIEQLFTIQSEVVAAWTKASELTLKLIGQLIADYERSPLLDAEVKAATAAAVTNAYAGLNSASMSLVKASGVSYKAQLAPYKLDVLENTLNLMAYEKGFDLTMQGRSRIASALGSALSGAGKVAGAALGSVTAHGSLVERSFS